MTSTSFAPSRCHTGLSVQDLLCDNVSASNPMPFSDSNDPAFPSSIYDYPLTYSPHANFHSNALSDNGTNAALSSSSSSSSTISLPFHDPSIPESPPSPAETSKKTREVRTGRPSSRRVPPQSLCSAGVKASIVKTVHHDGARPHLLAPELPKSGSGSRGPWRANEDCLLRELVHRFGPCNWSTIATYLPHRSGKQARERWINQLNPSVKKKNWSPADDRMILSMHSRIGNKWSAIALLLTGRTDNAVKNRFNSTLKRAMRECVDKPMTKSLQEDIEVGNFSLNEQQIERIVDRIHSKFKYRQSITGECYGMDDITRERTLDFSADLSHQSGENKIPAAGNCKTWLNRIT